MSEAKIRAIVKRPDEQYGHVTNISNTLRNLQRIVEGPIEVVRITEKIVCICNEEGKIRNLQRNFYLGKRPFGDLILGEVAIVGVEDDEFVDLDLDFQVWKTLLKNWGN